MKHTSKALDCPSPSSVLAVFTRALLAQLQTSVQAEGVPWQDPHIGSNERGEVLLEWWQEKRSLTVFIRSEEQVDYLKAWGSDIVKEMEEGELNKISDFVALSHWLYQGETISQ